jgi:histidine triad (HIT) family protein
MKCEHCEIVQGKSKANVLYEDNEVVIAIKDLAATAGQITIFPKEHFTIMELVPDNILKKCSQLANKVSIAVFEALGSQGTNVVVQNGLSAGQKVPHFAMEVIPRIENDGLNLQWEPKQLEEHIMESVVTDLKEGLESFGKEKPKKKEESSKEKEDSKNKKTEDNYLIKSINRLP